MTLTGPRSPRRTRYHRVMRLLVMIGLVAVTLKVLAWWLEPRMAFFPTRGVQETPASARLPFVDVRIPTDDGETLHAWWLEHPEPSAQILFFHGNGGNLSMWLDVFVELRRRGFSVLAVDYRGYGDSTGRPSEGGLYRDADATVRVFTERLRRAGSPVIYWGRSIGSAVAASAASRGGSDALVLESPFPDMRSIFAGNPAMQLLSVFSSYRFPVSRFIERYDRPLLVIHGDADSIIPYAAGMRVFDRAPGVRKRLVTIPHADHNDLHVVNPTMYWKAIEEFVGSLGIVSS
jgi:fermentation-respiration switch protein FrsA (DUF1100 family)